MAVGLPTPRPTIRQIKHGDVIAVSRPDGSGDVTQALTDYGQSVGRNIDGLSGFIFCQKSPSCGMERVKVYYEHGKGSANDGVGLFTKQIMELNPLLPCEENGRLNDAGLRENFIIRVYTYKLWQELVASGLTKHKLIKFHSERKYLLMSHHTPSYKSVGKLLGNADMNLEEMADKYIAGLMAGLKHMANRKSHTNTLHHLQGYFKSHLNTDEKSELTQHIDDYRTGLAPLLVPLTLINHYLKQHSNDYLNSQVYLSPYPDSLKLRYGI